ncbi:hypothetical protein J6TS2_49510 [Heyndrickxia sporothermodurans]|nr:hypothetical protein J6TS2_49510 [Heyndrickxia sporothermodurans]
MFYLLEKGVPKHLLKQKHLQAKEITYEIKDLPAIFCRLHNYEQVSYASDVKVDFVIDTDTDIIYSPSY